MSSRYVKGRKAWKEGDAVHDDPAIIGVCCSVVYDWLVKEGERKCVLIDIRSGEDYSQSHICSPLALNVPNTLLNESTLSDHSVMALLSTQRDRDVLALRFQVENVVLVGYSGRVERELDTLLTLANAFGRYSSRDTHHTIYYLIGGFIDFAHQYPRLLNCPPPSTHSPYVSTQVGDSKAISPKNEDNDHKSIGVNQDKSGDWVSGRTKENGDKSSSENNLGSTGVKGVLNEDKPGDSRSIGVKGVDKHGESRSILVKNNAGDSNSIGVSNEAVPSKSIGVVKNDAKDSKSMGVSNEAVHSIVAKNKPGQSKGVSPRGLRNMGNTCFINSVVQCLLSVRRLTYYFRSCKYKRDMKKGVLCELFHTLVVEEEIGVSGVRDFTAENCVSYSKGQQHDAHEFLNFILDGLHEDLKKDRRSLISDCFQGLLKSTVRCLTCSGESVTFDVFMFLALPIPDKSDCTLRDCLDEFYRVEQLSGIYCDKCGGHRDASKGVAIWTFPPHLIIFFNRFLYSNGKSRRNDVLVSYPLAHLDVSPFVLHPPVPHYSLHAVVNHQGTLDNGHYSSHVLSHSHWYHCDDSIVRPVTAPPTSNSAYILFYECTHTPVI